MPCLGLQLVEGEQEARGSSLEASPEAGEVAEEEPKPPPLETPPRHYPLAADEAAAEEEERDRHRHRHLDCSCPLQWSGLGREPAAPLAVQEEEH